MPPKYVKRTKKRTYKKRANKKYRPIFKPQSLIKVGFPKTTAVKLRYITTVLINPPAAQLGYHYFRANSCYDPDYTGVGHQPMNFDMWSALYNHYIVVGSKITVHYAGDGGTSASSQIWGVALTDDVTTTTSPATLMENGTTKYRIGNLSSNYGVTRAPNMTKGYSCKKFFNIKNPMDNIRTLGAQITADPSEIAFFSVFGGPLPDTANDLPAQNFTVCIDYIVIFSEPKEQAQS